MKYRWLSEAEASGGLFIPANPTGFGYAQPAVIFSYSLPRLIKKYFHPKCVILILKRLVITYVSG